MSQIHTRSPGPHDQNVFLGAKYCARRSDRPKPAFRKVILDGDRRSDGRYLEISASSEECCIRKAVNERDLNSGPVGLADAISEDEAATGTAFALGQIE